MSTIRRVVEITIRQAIVNLIFCNAAVGYMNKADFENLGGHLKIDSLIESTQGSSLSGHGGISGSSNFRTTNPLTLSLWQKVTSQ